VTTSHDGAGAATCIEDCDGSGSTDGMGLLGLCLAILGGLALALTLTLLLLRRGLSLRGKMLPTYRLLVPRSRDRVQMRPVATGVRIDSVSAAPASCGCEPAFRLWGERPTASQRPHALAVAGWCQWHRAGGSLKL